MIQLFHAVRDGPRARAPNHNPQAETLLLIRPNGPMRTKFEEEQNTMTLKKISVLVLALVMVLVMGTVAFATGADDTYTGSGNDNADNFAGLSANPQTIPLTKGIVFFNANGSAVYEPNVTFNYAVAPDTAVVAEGTTATVTDSSSVQRNVYPGPADGVTGTTISFAASTTNGTHTAAATGTEVEKTGNLSLDITKFARPGIYRYVITESVTSPSTGATDSANLQAAGLTARDTDYATTRYLDVYIHYGTSGDLEMYGAVIFKSSSSTPGQDSITTATEKTTGFEPGLDSASDYSTDKNVDKYYTYDFTVKKTVSGSMADKNHEFPFYVTVSNSINGAMFTYTEDGAESFTGATNASGVVTLNTADFSIGADSTSSSLTLKNNDTIVLVGLPSKQDTGSELAVVIKEFNNTYDTYTPSASATRGTLTMTTGTAMTAQTGYDATGSFAVKTNDIAAQVLAIDNSLTEISPTGYVARIAPYALMLIGGATLFIILAVKRRKNEEEEA